LVNETETLTVIGHSTSVTSNALSLKVMFMFTCWKIYNILVLLQHLSKWRRVTHTELRPQQRKKTLKVQSLVQRIRTLLAKGATMKTR